MEPTYTYGNAPYSENIRQKLASTGEFEILTDTKFRTSDQYLMEGDILVNEPVATGHAIMVLEDGPLANSQAATLNPANTSKTADEEQPAAQVSGARIVKATEYAHFCDSSVAGVYECTATVLNMRNGAGAIKKTLTTIRKGTRVRCYGYYNMYGTERWLYVAFAQDGVTYEAFASAVYLQKV